MAQTRVPSCAPKAAKSLPTKRAGDLRVYDSEHGQSDVLPSASFAAFGDAISELLDQLAVGPRSIYLHDFGAPVGLQIAMEAPELVSGLVIQNANAHRTGFGPQWE